MIRLVTEGVKELRNRTALTLEVEKGASLELARTNSALSPLSDIRVSICISPRAV